jgi:hypothetical protein
MKKIVCVSLCLMFFGESVLSQNLPKLDALPNPVGVATPAPGKTEAPSQSKPSAVQSNNTANVNGLMISNTSIAPGIAPMTAPSTSSSLYSGFSKDVLSSQPNHSSYFQNTQTCTQVGITRTCN